MAAADEVDVVATRTMIVVATRTKEGRPLVLTLNPQQHLPTKQTPMLNVRDSACLAVHACN